MDIEIKEELKRAKEKLEHATEELETFKNKKQDRLDELLLKLANGEERNDNQKKYWGIMIDDLREEKARLKDREKFFMDHVAHYLNKLSEFNNNDVNELSSKKARVDETDPLIQNLSKFWNALPSADI
ncbi:18384_t:CDS:2, partial [Funneliformis geosporum]